MGRKGQKGGCAEMVRACEGHGGVEGAVRGLGEGVRMVVGWWVGGAEVVVGGGLGLR